jgi:hypothetical protein
MVESVTNRRILVLGFGISLFILHIPIRTIGIFFALGTPLIVLWSYVGDKSKQQQQQSSCICHICKHEQAAESKLHEQDCLELETCGFVGKETKY